MALVQHAWLPLTGTMTAMCLCLGAAPSFPRRAGLLWLSGTALAFLAAVLLLGHTARLW